MTSIVFTDKGPYRVSTSDGWGNVWCRRDGRHFGQNLRSHIVPLFACHHSLAFLKHNASTHMAMVTMYFLHQHSIRTVPLSDLNPDSNHFEQWWLKRLSSRPTLMELEAIFPRVRAQVPNASVNRLILSMCRWCMAVLNTRRWHKFPEMSLPKISMYWIHLQLEHMWKTHKLLSKIIQDIDFIRFSDIMKLKHISQLHTPSVSSERPV